MTTKNLSVDVDYLVQEYAAGRGCKQLAKELHVSVNLVLNRLKERGIRPDRLRIWRKHEAEIVRCYLQGESAKSLQDRLHVSRAVIVRKLKARGIYIRGRQEAEKLKWERMSEDKRQRQVHAAHLTRRGKGERSLEKMLVLRGISVTAQQPIGPYHCDLGACPVAVEVLCDDRYLHETRPRDRMLKRFHYFLDLGWFPLAVIFPITKFAANRIAAYIEHVRRHPASRRCYRVIWGTGELAASGSLKKDQLSFVLATDRRLYSKGRHGNSRR